jgi:hypothetical protein
MNPASIHGGPRPRRAPVTFNQAPDGTVTLDPSDEPTWQQYVTDFDTAVQAVSTNVASLQQLGSTIQSKYPDLWSQYQQLLADGQAWLAKLQDLQATRNKVTAWMSGLWDTVTNAASTASSAVADVAEQLFPLSSLTPMQRRQALGIVPLVVAGVGLAAFGAAVYGAIQWAKQHDEFKQRLAAIDSQAQADIARGVPSQTAYANAIANVNKSLGGPSGPPMSLATQALIIGGLVIVAIFVVPRLFRERS